jgi:hypothetical protein
MTEAAAMKREATSLRERETCPMSRLRISDRRPPWGVGPWPVRHDRPRRRWRPSLAALRRGRARARRRPRPAPVTRGMVTGTLPTRWRTCHAHWTLHSGSDPYAPDVGTAARVRLRGSATALATTAAATVLRRPARQGGERRHPGQTARLAPFTRVASDPSCLSLKEDE